MKGKFKSIVVAVLTFEAKLALVLNKPKIVAVTGNVGKTSTKDAIYSVLKDFYKTRKSDKSFNSEIGVPLAILGLKNAWSNPIFWLGNFILGFFKALGPVFPKVLVLEIGADHPGDIRSLVSWVKPDVVVYTRMQTVPVHVENFSTPEKMFEEKSYLARALKPNGVVVINGDDDKMKMFTKGVKDSRKFGFNNGVDVRGENYNISYDGESGIPSGITFRAYSALGSADYHLDGVVGKHHAYPILAAVAVAEVFGITPKEALGALDNHKTPSGRMKILKGEKCLIIDDSYNSSPVALEEGLLALSDIKTNGRKIAVLGDMKELGKYALGEHKRLGVVAGKTVNTLVTVGEMAENFAKGAIESGMNERSVLVLSNSEEASTAISQIVKEGDVVLIKGSQSMRMEHIVKALLHKDLSPDEHLVRQEREWEKR